MTMTRQIALVILNILLITGCAGLPASQTLTPVSARTAVPSRPAGQPVPFRTLARGFRLGGGLPGPTLMIAVDAAGRDAIRDLVSPEHRALLETIDLRREALLAVFRQTMPSGGYAVTINTITLADGEIFADVTLSEDDPAFPRIEAATLPYHLVAVDASAFPAGRNMRYRLVSGDAALAEGALSLR